MSLNFATVTQVTFNNGAGQRPASLPIQLCKPIGSEGPREIRLDIPWTSAPYSASFSNRRVLVNCDLAGQQVATPLSAIRYVKIDNTYNDVPVSVQFTDTLDTIVCPANAVVGAQVMTNSQNFVVFGDGFFTGRTPITSVFLSNTPQEPFYFQDVAKYESSGGLVDAQYTPAVAALYNYTAQFGRAVITPRNLVLFYAGLRNAGLGLPVIGATMDGVPFTARGSFAAPFGAVSAFISLWTMPLAGVAISGALQLTANVNLTYSAYALYVLTDLASITPFDIATDYAGAAASPISVLPVTAIPGSFACYAALNDAALASPPYAYGGAVLDGYFSSTNAFAFYSQKSDVVKPVPLSTNLRMAIGGVWI